ncbi:MAG: hypothetical protein WCI74_12670, partial [Actinomycetes bacterium]
GGVWLGFGGSQSSSGASRAAAGRAGSIITLLEHDPAKQGQPAICSAPECSTPTPTIADSPRQETL